MSCMPPEIRAETHRQKANFDPAMGHTRRKVFEVDIASQNLGFGYLCPGSTEVAKCKGCGWPICPACNELTDRPGGTKNIENRISADEGSKEAKGVRSEAGWGEAQAHREECLLFQEREVRPALLEPGQRHWLYTALGVIRYQSTWLFLSQYYSFLGTGCCC